MNQEVLPETGEGAKARKSLWKTIVVASCLFALDAIVLNLPSIAVATAFALFFWLIPATLYHAIKENREMEVFCAKKVLVYLVMVAAIFVSFSLNNRLAEQRAEVLVAAIDKFHDHKGSYPKSLQELVPEYLDAIPRANYTVSAGTFFYFFDGDSARLMYYCGPPFHRRIFRFKGREWYILD
ncbi:MAG: hypothetical protein AB1646_10005 [Thermodesulfobacteriota bacterium]